MVDGVCVPWLGMHIMEGFLPPHWAGFWTLATLPFLVWGIGAARRKTSGSAALRLLLAMAGALALVLSALKLPSVAGSCSHPTGVALGAILFGPLPMVAMATIVLVFQALLLAHGGLTTLGANVFSMGIVGPFVAWALHRLGRRFHAGDLWAVGCAAALSDLATYAATSFQLAFAFPDPAGGVWVSAAKFLGVFMVTQIPLAAFDGLVAAGAFAMLARHAGEEIRMLGLQHLHAREAAA